jgi:hypothetical protein
MNKIDYVALISISGSMYRAVASLKSIDLGNPRNPEFDPLENDFKSYFYALDVNRRAINVI